MNRRIAEVRLDFEAEMRLTRRVLEALAALAEGSSAPQRGRGARDIAWHVVQAYGSILGQIGWDLGAPSKHEPCPNDAALLARYAAVSDALLDVLRTLVDADLDLEDAIYGEMWRRERTLTIFLRHEIHHRAQIATHLRWLGGFVPAIYGPSADDR